MSNITINSLFRRFSDSVILYLIILQSLSVSTNASTTTTTMHVTCGTDIELSCPIRSIKRSDEVISWFRPNSSHTHLKFIAIGDILFPEYSTIGRFNLISSSSSISRLSISNVLIEDHGFYTCKSSSNGQHTIKLLINSHPYISPSSPLLLYPVNRTFSMTCSLLCDLKININDIKWFVNGELLNDDNEDFSIETISSQTQRLTVYLNKKNKNFTQANYTCRYNAKEATILVRRRTKEELHRLPRQQGSSSGYLLQTVFDTGQRQYQSSVMTIGFLLLLWFY